MVSLRRAVHPKIMALVGAAAVLALSACTLPPAPTPGGGQATPGPLPELNEKPRPEEIAFNGCPPEGDGGDAGLNRLKNRVDAGDVYPVTFESVAGLSWPKPVERRRRDAWSAEDATSVARYEGIPISIQGYLAGARRQGPESTNCHGADAVNVDWHVWLTQAAGADRSASIVVETTPRVRPRHSGWTLSRLQGVVQNRERIRISGWLMLDPEHPDQLGQTRGTLWEIHPVTRIEVERDGQWIDLDDLPSQP